MIILDTNVVSELLAERPSERVRDWVRSTPAAEIYITAITVAEMRLGLALLPDGRRKTLLSEKVLPVLNLEFADRTLPFDVGAAAHYASVIATRRQLGRPMGQFDAQIAAISRSRFAHLATRNIVDFDGIGLDLIDPWKTPPV